MRTTSSIQFYCRPSKANRQGLSTVEVSICINGSRKFINLPIKFPPSEFNRKRQPSEIVEAINLWRDKINRYVNELLRNDMPLTADSLREVIRTGGIRSYTIEDLFEDYLAIQRERVGKDLSKGVYRKYELVRDMFFSYIDKEKECTSITNALIQKIYADLNKKYDSSTSAGYMTKLKTIVSKFAMDNDRIKINPFSNIKIQKGKKEITYLTNSEIEMLCSLKLENQSLQNVLNCFLIMCGTGLAYADLKHLTTEDIKESEGTFYIKKRRVKTNQEFTTVILPFAVGIIKNGIKVISNQKMNDMLKVIEGLTDIKTHLHCHLARHTYATILLNKGVSLNVVAKCLGNTEKICGQFYAKMLDNTVIDAVAKVL